MQQDAQEFLIYLLNTIAEILNEEQQQHNPRMSAPAACEFIGSIIAYYHPYTVSQTTRSGNVATPTVSADGVSLHSTPATEQNNEHRFCIRC